jgi:hypothetical protein
LGLRAFVRRLKARWFWYFRVSKKLTPKTGPDMEGGIPVFRILPL